jgi:RNA-directed DNA polymerase
MSSWSPHSYQSEGRNRGYSEKYLNLLEKDGIYLTKAGLPVVFTLGHLAAITDVPFRYLHSVVSRKTDPYRVFRLRKRNGKYRIITIPEPSLLCTQRWIHQNILLHCNVHPCSKAYIPRTSPYRNAETHCGTKWLVKIDIQRFFEAISESQVYRVFNGMGYRPLLSFELARLATRLGPSSSRYKKRRWQSRHGYKIDSYACDHIGHLPQGAPTSPMLANLVCISLDNRLSDLAESMDSIYTRYSDDIVFSGNDLNRKKALDLIRQCSKILSDCGFERNLQKTHVVPPGARKIVTGLLVDREKPRLTSEFRDNLRCHLYYATKYGAPEHCKRRGFKSLFGFREHLKGLISYAESVDPEFASRCQAQFQKIGWPPI